MKNIESKHHFERGKNIRQIEYSLDRMESRIENGTIENTPKYISECLREIVILRSDKYLKILLDHLSDISFPIGKGILNLALTACKEFGSEDSFSVLLKNPAVRNFSEWKGNLLQTAFIAAGNIGSSMCLNLLLENNGVQNSHDWDVGIFDKVLDACDKTQSKYCLEEFLNIKNVWDINWSERAVSKAWHTSKFLGSNFGKNIFNEKYPHIVGVKNTQYAINNRIQETIRSNNLGGRLKEIIEFPSERNLKILFEHSAVIDFTNWDKSLVNLSIRACRAVKSTDCFTLFLQNAGVKKFTNWEPNNVQLLLKSIAEYESSDIAEMVFSNEGLQKFKEWRECHIFSSLSWSRKLQKPLHDVFMKNQELFSKFFELVQVMEKLPL